MSLSAKNVGFGRVVLARYSGQRARRTQIAAHDIHSIGHNGTHVGFDVYPDNAKGTDSLRVTLDREAVRSMAVALGLIEQA